MATISARNRSQREHLQHLALVFGLSIRLKIVAELYMREMSPKEFFEEFGGGSLERIAQNFAFLEKHGWLERVGDKEELRELEEAVGRPPKKRPHGNTETLYRATETPFFDAETWALLPYSLRLAYSWSTFKATAKELRQGIEGVVFEGRPSRDLSCSTLELDALGWHRIIQRIDANFDAIFAEEINSKIRARRTGEELLRIGLLLLGCELPTDERPMVSLADGIPNSLTPFPERMAPIFADELSMQILTELSQNDLSIKEFHRRFARHLNEGVVRYRFARLKKLDWIAIVKKVKRRAAYENVYRATKPAVKENGPWADVPKTLAATKTWKTFLHLTALIKDSISSGAFDLRDDRHLSWCIVQLDQRGWRTVIENMEKLTIFIHKEAKDARERIEKGEEPLTMAVALGALESGVSTKAP